ncbi:hypothetical protein [Oscillibacter sp.]|jgi:hypothetical protein|uniref:hypothetical protein n=1 Tax=Oscillibacter sp. TaxID=1945593 RepID=UPI00216CDD5A|nr:hypothetical protein [Oscillibacter sp.]MCI9648019.1 hypothetical protein [Oscillibacter sp.]
MAIVRILMAVVMTLGRLLPFLIVGVLLFLLWRRSVRRGKDPEFKGPVYTVDYEEVEDGEEE